MAHADPDAGLDIQIFIVMIHDCPDFVEFVSGRKELAQWAVIGILLEGSGPFIIEVIGDPRCRNEFQVSKTAGIVGIHDWIKDEVHRVKMQPYDWPDFGSNVPGLPVRVIDAELKIDAIEKLM